MQRQGHPHPQGRNESESSPLHIIIITKILSIVTILLRIILYPLKLSTSILFTRNEYDGLQSGDKAALAFKSYSEKCIPSSNASMLEFESMKYSKCIEEGHRRNQFVFVYLHSPLHPKSETFVKMLNGSEEGLSLSSVLSDCVKWGGNIHHAEGSKVATDFQVSSYPFCALLVCKSRTSVELFWRMSISDTMSISDLCAKMGTAIAVYYPILREEETRRNRRREEIQLREEQDREFQQTLLEDQRREAERLAQQEADRQVELQAQREIEIAQQREQSRLDNARSLLQEEPKTGNIARLRIMFPSGTRTERRFLTSDTIEVIQAFVILHMHEKEIPITHFQLEMNYPKKVLDDDKVTIEDSGLGKMAVLMVVDLDA